jgi:hypothetical protein
MDTAVSAEDMAQLETELAHLRAEVERLNDCCDELHYIIDNGGYPSGKDYADMTARAEKAEAALADHITALEIADRSADEQMRYKREAEKLWKEFITLLEITEESDSGYEFNPNKISSCRAMDGKRLNEILVEARGIVFDAPKE